MFTQTWNLQFLVRNIRSNDLSCACLSLSQYGKAYEQSSKHASGHGESYLLWPCDRMQCRRLGTRWQVIHSVIAL